MPESPLSLDDGKQRYIHDLFQLVAKFGQVYGNDEFITSIFFIFALV